MHVISEKKLRDAWTLHPDAETPLRAWHRVAARAKWGAFADVRAAFPHADLVGHLVVFNIGGNKYRLITAIHFNRGKVYVRHVLTHKEYDLGLWKEPTPPKRPKGTKKPKGTNHPKGTKKPKDKPG